MAMRGINLITAMGVVAELGDLSRFSKPTQLMAYLGLVPSEHSSGDSRHQGRITKSGNRHVRRLLIESAWCYRFAARKSREIEQRAQRASPRGTGGGLESTETAMRALPCAERTRNKQLQGGHGGGT